MMPFPKPRPLAAACLLLAQLCHAAPAFADAGPVPPDAGDPYAARRAELLRQREAIDAELRTLEPPPGSAAEAPEAPHPHDGVETIIVTAHQTVPPPAGQTATTLDRAQFEFQPGLSIAEALSLAPGVTSVQGNGPRDVSISVRGSNNRQTYGVRNVKVFEDGFDVTQPDGLARTDLSDPHAYGHIDVVRGPSSAWYGNYATGGALVFHSRSGADIDGVEAGLDAGSYGFLNAYLTAGGASADYDYAAFLSNARGASATEHTDYLTTTANLSANLRLSARDRLVLKLIDNELDADLALRLSLAQYRQNPYQHGCAQAGADSAANGCATLSVLDNGFNGTRTPLSPAQAGIGRHDRRTIVGARWEHALDAATQWQTQAVFDNRDITQPTGAVGFDGSYPSFNLRSDLRREGRLFGLPAVAAAGLFYNYEDINSSSYNLRPEGHAAHGGVTQQVDGHQLNAGLRLREELQLAGRWTAVLGLGGEYSEMEGLSTAFQYPDGAAPLTARIAARREFFDVAPELALEYAASESLTLHARAAAGYGTPQLSNLFTTASGDPGNNTALDPQRNLGFDLGADWRYRERLRLSVAGFYEFFRDELVTQSAGSDKQSYTYNAPKSEHRGVELAAELRPLPRVLPGAALSVSYLYDDQVYRDYADTFGTSGALVEVSRDGKKIPGVQPQYLNARLAYDQPAGALQGLGAYLELNWREDFWLDNANLLKAPGYELVNLNLHYGPPAGRGALSRLSFYFAVQNLFDKTYVGSASNLADRVDSSAASLAATGGSIYAGAPRTYYGGLRVRF